MNQQVTIAAIYHRGIQGNCIIVALNVLPIQYTARLLLEHLKISLIHAITVAGSISQSRYSTKKPNGDRRMRTNHI